MNKTMIIGNLTANPESRTTASGKSVCNFSVAVNEGSGDNRITTYFRCAAWNKTGETCQKYLSKGSKVYIEGRMLAPNAYLDKQGKPAAQLDLMVNTVEFLSARNDGGQQGTAPAHEFTQVETNDLPF